MADFTALRGKSTLGPVPTKDEATNNIHASETAPAPKLVPIQPTRVDGRSLRRSGRTVQLATRVTPEFDRELRATADREGILIVELLERALQAYKTKSGS